MWRTPAPAFGMMKGFRWGFIILSTVAVIAIIVYLIKCRRTVPALLGVALSMIAGGGIGNQIDRIANGFVVDFLEFQFIDFAIFNIARLLCHRRGSPCYH